MSHDRGCFKCHEDPSEYANCAHADCPKRKPFNLTRDLTIAGIQNRVMSGLPEGVTQADLDAATPLPPLGDSRRRHQRGQDTHIITVTEPGYDVVLFFNEDGGAEAVISRPNDKPTGVNIAPPAPGRHIVVERIGERFQVVYRDARK